MEIMNEETLETVELLPKNPEKEEKPGMKEMQDIFHVCKLGFLIPVQTLVEKQGVEVLLQFDKEGYSPIHWAALGGHHHLFNFFIQIKAPLDYLAKNPLGSQPIHWASVHGHIQVIQMLLQNGVPVDSADNKGCSPLIISAQYGHTTLSAFLIGKGARIDATDKEGDNALHWAAFKGHCELTRLLIYSGLNPRAKDNFGQFPLHLASLNGNLLTVKLLCEQDGVDFEMADHNGNTPYKLANGRKNSKVVDYLGGLRERKTRWMPNCNFKTLLFGPPGATRHSFMFMLFMTFGYGYPAYFLRVLPYTLDLQITHFLFFINTILLVYCLFKSTTMDPGFLPKNLDEYDKALKQVALLAAEWKKEGENPLSRLCHTCRLIRPYRSKHCRVTNRCIKHFDHYCPYIYNAVGYRNRHYFIVFVVCMSYCSVFGTWMAWYMYKYVVTDYLLVVGGCILAFFSLTNVGLTLSMVYCAVKNLTTNERINKRRYGYLKDGNGKFYNPFDQKALDNLKEFFHLKEPLVLESDPACRFASSMRIV